MKAFIAKFEKYACPKNARIKRALRGTSLLMVTAETRGEKG